MPKCKSCGEHVDCPDCRSAQEVKQSNTLTAYFKSAREGFDEHLDYQEDAAGRLVVIEEPHDAAHDIADTVTPHYTSDLLQVAANCSHMATDEPECGPAFDGTPTPTNIIAANVYEAIIADLHEYAGELKEATEEAAEVAGIDLLEGAEELAEMLYDGSPPVHAFPNGADDAPTVYLQIDAQARRIEYGDEADDDRAMRAARLWEDATEADCEDVAEVVHENRQE